MAKLLKFQGLTCLLCLVSVSVYAGNAFAPKKGLPAKQEATVSKVRASGRISFGMEGAYSNNAALTKVSSNMRGAESDGCNLNIGAPSPASSNVLNGGRYGPQAQQANIIIPNGGVYNICN